MQLWLAKKVHLQLKQHREIKTEASTMLNYKYLAEGINQPVDWSVGWLVGWLVGQ